MNFSEVSQISAAGKGTLFRRISANIPPAGSEGQGESTGIFLTFLSALHKNKSNSLYFEQVAFAQKWAKGLFYTPVSF